MNVKGRSVEINTKESGFGIKSSLLFETRKYHLTGIEPMLGSQPASKTLRTEFVASKAPSPAEVAEEDDLLGSMDEKGLTVFLRDDANGQLIMLDYMLRGFFKGSLEALINQTGIKMPRSKIDKFLFVGPRRIPIYRDGEAIVEEDDQIERPLRAETMRGPRVSLAASESIDAGWEITIEVTLLPNPESKASKAVTWDAVEMALDYGRFQGLGQWRTGGNGRFVWERVENDE